jgi:hypothetical protein
MVGCCLDRSGRLTPTPDDVMARQTVGVVVGMAGCLASRQHRDDCSPPRQRRSVRAGGRQRTRRMRGVEAHHTNVTSGWGAVGLRRLPSQPSPLGLPHFWAGALPLPVSPAERFRRALLVLLWRPASPLGWWSRQRPILVSQLQRCSKPSAGCTQRRGCRGGQPSRSSRSASVSASQCQRIRCSNGRSRGTKS